MSAVILPPFKDRDAMRSYERDGFVVFPGLAEAEVPQLVAVYEAMLAEVPPSDLYFSNPMTGTMFLSSRDLRKKINARIGEIIGPHVLSVFERCRFIGAGLRVKLPGPGSTLSLHQDPSVVNEEVHWSLNVSVALFDATAENGTLQFIPGSHTYMPKFRSLDHSDGVIDIGDELPKQVKTVPLRPGDAIFYANAVLHGSGPNASAHPRPLVLGTVMSPGASLTVFLRDAERPTRMECFAVPDDYFTDFEDFDRDFELRPNHKRLADVQVAAPPSREDVVAAGRAHLESRRYGRRNSSAR
jgi:hypothetical protein